ncbi:MAG: glycosyltransferase [Planctomycetes bacterium]|nr:glycosyltransferase [Planctomycetota bacterium]
MIKLLEYMAFSKPIIAFDLPEHRVSAGDAAVYAEPNSESDFAAQIIRLIDEPEKQKLLGKIGRERIEANLSWCHQENNLINVYKQLFL